MLCSLLSLIATARPRALPRPLQHSRSCSLCYLRNRLYASPRWAADRETDRRADMLGAVIKRLSLGSLARPHQRGQVPSLSKGHRFLSGGPDRSCGSVRGRGGCRAPRSVFATAPVPAVSWTCKIRNAGSEFVGVSASFPHKSKGDSRAARSGASLPGAVPAPRSRPPAPTGPAAPLTLRASSGLPASSCTQPMLKQILDGGSGMPAKISRAASQSPPSAASTPSCQRLTSSRYAMARSSPGSAGRPAGPHLPAGRARPLGGEAGGRGSPGGRLRPHPRLSPGAAGRGGGPPGYGPRGRWARHVSGREARSEAIPLRGCSEGQLKSRRKKAPGRAGRGQGWHSP